EPAMPITSRPAISASCTAALPTPPAAVWTSTRFASTPRARRSVQHVIGDLIIRKARRRLERATGRQGVCRSRRHGDVFGIAAGAGRQVAGADENRLAERRLGGVGAVRDDGAAELDAG